MDPEKIIPDPGSSGSEMKFENLLWKTDKNEITFSKQDMDRHPKPTDLWLLCDFCMYLQIEISKKHYFLLVSWSLNEKDPDTEQDFRHGVFKLK